jgi:hypothetical protein
MRMGMLKAVIWLVRCACPACQLDEQSYKKLKEKVTVVREGKGDGDGRLDDGSAGIG